MMSGDEVYGDDETSGMNLHDRLALRVFGRTRADAHGGSTCVRCGLLVAQDTLDRQDAKEYRISGLCPACFEELTPEPER